MEVYDLLVVGDLNPDLILAGDVLPEFGQAEKIVSDANLTLGSSAAIFACGAARLGLKVALAAKVGRDVFGDFVIKELEKRQVSTAYILRDPLLHTGLSVILLRGADRAILTYPGAIPALKAGEIPRSLLANSRHLHLASYYLLPALQPGVTALFEAARRSGLTTSMDTNYDPDGRWNGGLERVLPHTDLLLPNETECRAVAGEANLDRAIEVLATQVGTLAVKLGANGARAVRGKLQVTMPAVPVDVVDTVGAGDSFDAGFVYGYLAGWPLERSLRLAVTCGALSTRAAGGTAAQPDLEEAMTLLED